MTPIRVAVNGASGRMGQEVVKAVCLDLDTQIVGAIEAQVNNEFLTLPDGSTRSPSHRTWSRFLRIVVRMYW